MKGQALTLTNIKPMAGGAAVAQLQVNDYAFGDVGITDLLNFDHFYRANGERVELGVPCKAWKNNLQLTDVQEPDPEPATGEIMRQSFSHDGGKTFPVEEDVYWTKLL